MTKSLYGAEERYNPDGMEVDRLAHEVLAPIFQDFVARGYSPREVSHMIVSAALNLEFEFVLGKQFAAMEAERDKLDETQG